MEAFVNEDRLKELIKSAVLEVLEERSDFLRDIIEEAFEDFSLARAIEEGDSTETISRDEVFSLL
ncbi:MAG TPA: hypothetical protein VKF81_13225 [Blastocatellia bacterium]|nr:hypothetical protein [Blastocatellia bacterium]